MGLLPFLQHAGAAFLGMSPASPSCPNAFEHEAMLRKEDCFKVKENQEKYALNTYVR
tara:strand:- start:183 stop:353 length:171 start_codon:yes stop_codon:yes gene_type:complete